MLLQAKDVTHYFGGLCAVSDFNLTLEPDELVGIIWPERGRQDHHLQPDNRRL